MPLLRPYQQDLQSRIFDRWRAGDRNVLGVLSTGGGKSLIVSDTVRIFAQANRTVLVQAHRKELVSQMAMHVARQGVRMRIIGSKDLVASVIAEQRKELSGQSFVNPSAQVAVASVDTIMARMDHLGPWLRTVDLIVCDEAHHPSVLWVPSETGPVRQPNKWAAVFDACPNALGLGVTATPQRADGRGLGRHSDGVFDNMQVGLQTAELIGIKALTEYECYCPQGDFDVEKLKKGESGDYTQASMKAASEASKIVGDVVEHYMRYTPGRRALVFATDVETSVRMAQQFNIAGIPAASVSALTDPGVRYDTLKRLRDGRLKVVTNCDLLGEGVDVVSIDTCILARPTASLAVYLQQVGRCLRPDPDNPNKIAVIIDMVSNVRRHGFPDRKHNWTLDRRDRRASKAKDPDLVDVVICPVSGRPMEAIYIATCPHCFGPDGVTPGNHVKPSLASGPGRAVEVVAGDLCKLSAEDLAELRKQLILPNPDDVYAPAAAGAGAQIGQRNLAHARIEAQRALSDVIDLWAGQQRYGKGRDDSDIQKRFFYATGIDMITALGGSRQEMVSMAERVRSWMVQSDQIIASSP